MLNRVAMIPPDQTRQKRSPTEHSIRLQPFYKLPFMGDTETLCKSQSSRHTSFLLNNPRGRNLNIIQTPNFHKSDYEKFNKYSGDFSGYGADRNLTENHLREYRNNSEIIKRLDNVKRDLKTEEFDKIVVDCLKDFEKHRNFGDEFFIRDYDNLDERINTRFFVETPENLLGNSSVTQNNVNNNIDARSKSLDNNNSIWEFTKMTAKHNLNFNKLLLQDEFSYDFTKSQDSNRQNFVHKSIESKENQDLPHREFKSLLQNEIVEEENYSTESDKESCCKKTI